MNGALDSRRGALEGVLSNEISDIPKQLLLKMTVPDIAKYKGAG